MRSRIIPGFQISRGELVHLVQFNKNSKRYIGDPLNTLRIFNQYNCDEINIVDIHAWKYGINFNLLEAISEEIFVPLSYGGGINSLDDACKIIELGFEKIIFDNSLLKNENFINEFSENYGSQAVTLKINVFEKEGIYKIFNHKDSKVLDIDIEKYIQKLSKFKASEIILMVTNLDGTFLGPDLSIIRYLKNKINTHLIYSGGMSKISDFKECFNAGANAIITNNFFIMKKANDGIVFTDPKEIEYEGM